jgi:hypothetical protein
MTGQLSVRHLVGAHRPRCVSGVEVRWTCGSTSIGAADFDVRWR